jgi:hypothetical protein
MVRAAGLYPAGSRFESWLPYQSKPTRSLPRGLANEIQHLVAPPLGEAPLRR